MSVPISTLLPGVLPQVPGCPRPLAEQAVLHSAAEFCAASHLWSEELAPLDVSAETATYAFAPPAKALVAMVLSVTCFGRRLAPATEEWLDDAWPGWNETASAKPSHYLLPSAGRVRLAPTPTEDGAGALRVVAALVPSDTATELTEVVAQNFGETVVHGALARLLATPGKLWSNPELSVHHGRRFSHGLARARGQRIKGSTIVSVAARPRTFH